MVLSESSGGTDVSDHVGWEDQSDFGDVSGHVGLENQSDFVYNPTVITVKEQTLFLVHFGLVLHRVKSYIGS